MNIELIVAVDDHWLMGRDGDIPWRLPDDWKHFKRTTMGHPMIMGRATFESIGSKPLPGRTNIVVTTNINYTVPEGVKVAHDLEQAQALAEQAGASSCMIIGGSMIYRAFLPMADIVHLTVVHERFEGDTYFPALNLDAFDVIESTRHEADERHPHAFTMYRLARLPRRDVFHTATF